METRADAAGRPANVRQLTCELAADYMAVEDASPPARRGGGEIRT
jgi:hypothetical protein